jgi:hypothetical protein
MSRKEKEELVFVIWTIAIAMGYIFFLLVIRNLVTLVS